MPAEAPRLKLLLIAPDSPATAAVRAGLLQAISTDVQAATSLDAAQSSLQNQAFHAVLIEEAVPVEHPDALEAIYELAGSAVLLEINFGLMNTPRIVRQVRHLLRAAEATSSRQEAAARRWLQFQLCDTLAGLRLQTEIALRATGPELQFHLAALAQLVEAIGLQVQIGSLAPLPGGDLHLSTQVHQGSP